MPTRLKVFLYDLSYTILLGLSAVLICAVVKNTELWFNVFLCFTTIDILFHYLARTGFMREAKLAKRWARVTGRTYAEYPQTPEEKDAILGWATKYLVERATKASDGFRERDALHENFEKAKTLKPGYHVGAHVPQALPKIREDLRDTIALANRDYRRAHSMASSRHKSYLELWDLFRDMKMLPVDPTTGKAHTDPDRFRKSVKDAPAASDNVVGLTPETAS